MMPERARVLMFMVGGLPLVLDTEAAMLPMRCTAHGHGLEQGLDAKARRWNAGSWKVEREQREHEEAMAKKRGDAKGERRAEILDHAAGALRVIGQAVDAGLVPAPPTNGRKPGTLDTGTTAEELLRAAKLSTARGGEHYETDIGRAYLVLLSRYDAERRRPVQQSLFVRAVDPASPIPPTPAGV